MRTSVVFGVKTPDFSKFTASPHGQGGRGSIFRDFVQTSFMDGPLVFFTIHTFIRKHTTPRI